MKIAYTAVLIASVITGCSSMSGLSGNSEFACKAPDGVSCESVSGVYANSLQNNLPSQRASHKGAEGPGKKEGQLTGPLPAGTSAAPVISPRDLAMMDSGMPLREAPQILRVWLAPWEDELGDLHDQKFFYTVVNPGQWRIEANKQAIQDQFRPVYPLSKPQPSADNKSPSRAPASGTSAATTRPLGIPSER